MSRGKARSTISFNPLDDIESTPLISTVEPEHTKATSVHVKPRVAQSSKPRASIKKKSPLNKTNEKRKEVPPLVKTTQQTVKLAKSATESLLTDASSFDAVHPEPQPETHSATHSEPQPKAHSEAQPNAQPESLQNNITSHAKRHIVSFRDGATISNADIIRDADSGEWGFLEPAGRFVSLMHLSESGGAGRKVRDNFASMGLIGAIFAGPLGLLAASIFHSGSQTIFRARQTSSRDMYVSLSHESLRFLNNVIYGKGIHNG